MKNLVPELLAVHIWTQQWRRAPNTCKATRLWRRWFKYPVIQTWRND